MKGKHAAQAAHRRLIEAEARIAELEAARAADAKAAKDREHQLTTELTQARGDLIQRVKEASKDRIQAAIDQNAADLQEAHADFEDRIQRAAHYIGTQAELRISRRGVVELSRILGPQPGQLLIWAGKLPDNVRNRRYSRADASLVADIDESKGLNAAGIEGLAAVHRTRQ